MNLPEYYPVLDSYRSNYLDNRFFGLVFLYNKNGLIKKIGEDNKCYFYLRSLFKPVQASILTDNIINEFDFNEEELAVMQGSHSGENCHIKAVKSILDKIGLNENHLLCPIIAPLNTKNCTKCTKIHNNCSGKHSMMLAYCVYNGLDISNYNEINHPVQIEIKKKLEEFAETNDLITTKDGCTAPVYGLKIENIAKSFLNYYQKYKTTKLFESYLNNPYMIGGTDDSGKRTDTKIMELSPDLVSKVGAGGFIYVYNIKKEEILIIKMAQNNNAAREIIALEMLYKLNWLNERFYDDKIYTENNEPVGNYVLNGFD